MRSINVALFGISCIASAGQVELLPAQRGALKPNPSRTPSGRVMRVGTMSPQARTSILRRSGFNIPDSSAQNSIALTPRNPVSGSTYLIFGGGYLDPFQNNYSMNAQSAYVSMVYPATALGHNILVVLTADAGAPGKLYCTQYFGGMLKSEVTSLAFSSKGLKQFPFILAINPNQAYSMRFEIVPQSGPTMKFDVRQIEVSEF